MLLIHWDLACYSYACPSRQTSFWTSIPDSIVLIVWGQITKKVNVRLNNLINKLTWRLKIMNIFFPNKPILSSALAQLYATSISFLVRVLKTFCKQSWNGLEILAEQRFTSSNRITPEQKLYSPIIVKSMFLHYLDKKSQSN